MNNKFESKAALSVVGNKSNLLANPTDKEFQDKLKEADTIEQNSVINYNRALLCAENDTRFHNKVFTGSNVIVKLERFNFLIPSQVITGSVTINPLSYVTVSTPDYPQGKVVRNPLPYSYRGVVVAVGDEVADYRQSRNLTALEVGDFVELAWFNLKDYRYYPDKNKIDQITLDDPTATNYEGFAKIPVQFVEAIVKKELIHSVYGSADEMYGTPTENYDITMDDYDVQ